MSGTRRLREAVRVFLEKQGSANTVEIFDHQTIVFGGSNNESSRQYPSKRYQI